MVVKFEFRLVRSAWNAEWDTANKKRRVSAKSCNLFMMTSTLSNNLAQSLSYAV